LRSESRSRIEYSMLTNTIIVLGSYFNLTNKSNLIDRRLYDLLKFFHNLIVAYFFGPPCTCISICVVYLCVILVSCCLFLLSFLVLYVCAVYGVSFLVILLILFNITCIFPIRLCAMPITNRQEPAQYDKAFSNLLTIINE